MAKGKSSASSATRKKHARKAAAAQGISEEPPAPKEKKPKGKEKGSKKNKEPKKKVYIPPVKPAPVQPDPLDTLGLAQELPPDLLVVLRKLGKKDSITKRRALEDLQTDWVEKAKTEDHESPLVKALVAAVPVWLHHLPVLFTHSSRRIRLLAVGLHATLLRTPGPISTHILFYLSDVVDADQAESILGTWCMVAHDVDRQVSSFASASWDEFIRVTSSGSDSSSPGPSKRTLDVDTSSFSRLWGLVQRTLLDPQGVYLNINPPQPVVPLPVSRKSGTRTPQTPRSQEESSRTKGDEDEEREADRKARLRVSAFGAAEWVLSGCTLLIRSTTAVVTPSCHFYLFSVDTQTHIPQDSGTIESILASLDNLALWSSLSSAQVVPFLPTDFEGFGWAQPPVRKAAWSLLLCLLKTCKDSIRPLLPTLSTAVLRSGFVEHDSIVRSAMWQPFLTFLKDYPTCWELEMVTPTENEGDGDEDSDDDEDDAVRAPATSNAPKVSQAYKEFLQFLELGCSGSPIQGYPAIIVILSTIPPSVLTSLESPLESLFVSFWAAVDGRALSGLDRLTASKAFLSSLLECFLLFVRRLSDERLARVLLPKYDTEGPGAVTNFVAEQIGRVWDEVSSKSLKVEDGAAAGLLAKTLNTLFRHNPESFNSGWNSLAIRIRSSLDSTGKEIPTLVPAALQVFRRDFEPGTRPADAANDLLAAVIHRLVSQFEDMLGEDWDKSSGKGHLNSLVSFLGTFGEVVFEDEELSKAIDRAMQQNVPRILTLSPDVVLAYIRHRKRDDLKQQLWHEILLAIASVENPTSVLSSLLDCAESGDTLEGLRPSGVELDEVLARLVVQSLAQASYLQVTRRLLRKPEPFISEECAQKLVVTLADTLSVHISTVLHDASSSLEVFDPILELLSASAKHSIVSGTVALSILPDIFMLAFVIPHFRDIDSIQQVKASSLWNTLGTSAPEDILVNVLAIVKETLRDLLLDCSATISPRDIYHILSSEIPQLELDPMQDVFPAKPELDAMLDILPSSPADPSLGVLDPLVSVGFADDEAPYETSTFDDSGFSAYARVSFALLLFLSDDRRTARDNVWVLRHLLALAQYADELSKVPFIESSVFGPSVSQENLDDIMSRVQQLSAYLLSASLEEGWLPNATGVLLEGRNTPSTDGVLCLLQDMIWDPKARDTVQNSRLLHTVLQHVLSGATKAEAEQFLLLARKIEKTSPHTALAIISAVTQYAPEPQRLDRYRNELAASLLGIQPSRANTEGLWVLRRLVAVAPDPDSDIIFLPTPRAVNVMKACQQWISSDEDIDEEIETEMTLVFFYLAPILQNVPGAHWDFIFDVIENNLENSSFAESSTLTTLARTLRLIMAIQELAASNKALRSVWVEREAAILKSVRDLTAQKLDSTPRSTPLSVCRELAISIVQDLPESLIDQDTLSKMCHLVTDSSVVVQKMAYQMLHEAAAKRTEYIVVEAAMGSESTASPELPLELVLLLQQDPIQDDEVVDISNVFGYLLGWMLTFDLFQNASFKVKSGYIEHLRRLDLLPNHFLPQVLNILGLYDGVSKAFKLDIWAVDEYYLDLFSEQSRESLPILAAHLYHRALLVVPSLFRSWLLDCRDRQLSNAVTVYTSNYFSPSIIRTELDQVKDPSSIVDLTDENLAIKVSANVNEVTASYHVDEHYLELKVKLPPDWPLHMIEIKDTNLVGVAEKRWRSWVLGVQQILRSGSIVDGLIFWKKNVASHFEGQTECAICYSIISPLDNSIPNKPCRTCKNRFHAACLYKWFKTSHTSNCPLCRSEIIQSS